MGPAEPCPQGQDRPRVLAYLARFVFQLRHWLPLGAIGGASPCRCPTLPMPDPADLAPLLAALLAADPPERPVMLRPRPKYLPHPLRRLA